MSKVTFLSFHQVITMIGWMFLKPYKIMVMKYWENKGMMDVSAFKMAQKTTKEEFSKLKD